MGASTQRLEEVARTLSRLWDDGDLDAVRDLYRDDAVFISPTPPNLGDFGTILHGRAEILRYYAACLEVIPRGAVTTIAVLTGIDMAVWVWDAGPAGTGADVVMFDDGGHIVSQHVTTPKPG